MSGHHQPDQGMPHHPMSIPNSRMVLRTAPWMPLRQVLPMQPGMSQQHRMVSSSQPRYLIRPAQNGQSNSQMYQQQPSQNSQIMHQINRNQPRPMQQPGSQQIQIQQPQGTPPNQQNFNISSPYTPPQQQFSNQHQIEPRHYNQPPTPQDRQAHHRIQQQGVQRPLTPQQQHAQSPTQRKSTTGMVRTSSSQNIGDVTSQSDQQQHYIVQTSAPTTIYNVVQGSSSQPQVVHQINIGDNQESSYNQRSKNSSIRHPVTQRPIQFTTQSSNVPIVRYSYPNGQQNQSSQPIVVHQPRNIIRQTTPGEYRQQYIQVVRSEPDFSGSTVYRMSVPSSEQNYVVSSQPGVYYRSTTPQQPNFAIRQALGHDGSYQQQIQASQTPVIIQSVDDSNGQLMFRMASTQRQTSTDSYDSGNYIQSSVPSVVEATVSEFAAEQHQRAMDEGSPDLYEDDSSPTKKAKLIPRSDKNLNSGVLKQSKKKVPIKTIDNNKTISTVGGQFSEYGNDDSMNGYQSGRPVITKEVLDRTAKSISQNLTMEEEAKAGIMLYMEQFVNKLVQETGRATNLRKSSKVQHKDVDYALRTRLKITPADSSVAENIASKFGK